MKKLILAVALLALAGSTIAWNVNGPSTATVVATASTADYHETLEKKGKRRMPTGSYSGE